MIIERRSLVKGLVALVAAPAIVKVASLMPVNAALQPGGLNYLTMDQITREAVRYFRNSNKFVKQVDEQYEADFAFMNGEQWLEADGTGTLAKGERLSGTEINALYQAKIGDTLRIRLPNDYVFDSSGAAEDIRNLNKYRYIKERRTLEPEFQVPAPLALAAAAVAVAPAVLKTPVTRRFWKLPQHSAASQED